MTREDLLKSSDYWIEIIQNKIFSDLIEYIEDNNISNEQLREILGVSKGRVSQIKSGNNLNFRIDSLVKLCISINKIPDFQLVDITEFIKREEESSMSLVFKETKHIQKPADEMIRYKQGLKYSKIYLPIDTTKRLEPVLISSEILKKFRCLDILFAIDRICKIIDVIKMPYF